MQKKESPLYWCFLLILSLTLPAAAGESEQAQPYSEVRYPTFSNGRLQSLLEAKTADVFDLSIGMPRIKLQDVVITLYDADNAGNTPDDQPPPVKMVTTSDRGYFTRQPPEVGSELEDVINLEGNVIIQQMKQDIEEAQAALRPRTRLPAGVATEIRCERAQWNDTLRVLKGDGAVTLIHEESTIDGDGFLYLPDDNALDSGSTADIKNWGGIVFIPNNARMEIIRDVGGPGGAAGRTIITCKETASYKLNEREIQFERDVRVVREGLTIEADILKVFLRREDEPPTEAQPDNEKLVPGQVKSIIATIGKRPGSVIVTGYRRDEDTGEEVMHYIAKGGRADFDYDTNRINLTDTREQRWPEVEFGSEGNRITDGSLNFVFAEMQKRDDAGRPAGGSETILDVLTTSGGRGEVVLRPRRKEGDTVLLQPTVVNYRGDMNYNRTDGRIRFRERVHLRRADLEIRSEILDIRMVRESPLDTEPSQLERITAEEEVDIRSGSYEAKSHRAEYNVHPRSGVDTLRLFGPPQATPPHPWIKDIAGNQISAPEIHMQRLETPVGMRDHHLVVARGGTTSCDFVAGGSDGDDKPKVINIKCEQGMEYHQLNKKARFEGQVTATSDNPEDNYVLTSDRLEIDFEETPDPLQPDEYDTWIRRITAEGNARLMQDGRVCEAIKIIRDFPVNDPDAGDIYLQGAPAQAGQPPIMAAYSEQIDGRIGSMFAAPLIKSTAKGDLIQANGPGELSMPDPVPHNEHARALIKFAGAASYEAHPGGIASDARFFGGVVLTQPSNSVVVTAEEMDARFVNDQAPAGFGGQSESVELEHIGRLRRAEGRTNVSIKAATARGGERIAVGDVGVVEFTGTGNIVRLTADRATDSKRVVIARDDDGMTLRAPEIEIREAQGITRASGPGNMQIPAQFDGGTESRPPTLVMYGENGSMVYNEVALNIRVSDNVRVVQPGAGNNWSRPSLDGVCDRMEITLLEPPAPGMAGEETLSRVQRMDALGSVLLRVFADPPPENPDLDWRVRPGTTFFTRGDQAIYDVPQGEISIFSLDNSRQPQLLLNIVEPGRPPQRQRLKADRFVLRTTTPRTWNFQGNLDSTNIRDGEPFDFVNN